MTIALPLSYYEKIRATKGVRNAAPFKWFGGLYKDAKRPDADECHVPGAVPGVVSGDHAFERSRGGLEA